MLAVPFREWKGGGVDVLSSFLMELDVRGLMLGGGSIFNGKIGHGRER